MSSSNIKYKLCTILITILFVKAGDAIKCFDCNSANNSACLDLHMKKMNAIIPIVDCAKSIPNAISKQFFCRKITQTILHVEKTPEVRITRGCGWVKSKRACYTNDNKDHLETVCQCFGDMCNGAPSLLSLQNLAAVAAGVLLLMARSRGYV